MLGDYEEEGDIALNNPSGFQMVQATDLIDTSTAAPKGSNLPDFATPTPVAKPVISPPAPVIAPPLIAPNLVPKATPLEDNSKSKQFNQRFDVYCPNVVYDCRVLFKASI
jgi:hypothetical protein